MPRTSRKPHVCDNCDKCFATAQLKHVYPDIPDLAQRTEAGNEIPSGECPDCGALTYVRPKLKRTLKPGQPVRNFNSAVAEFVREQFGGLNHAEEAGAYSFAAWLNRQGYKLG